MDKLIVDVREPDEFSAGHFDGAINVPLSTIPGNPLLSTIPKDSKLILYCRSGARSERALQILKSEGYSNLKNGINQEMLEKGTK